MIKRSFSRWLFGIMTALSCMLQEKYLHVLVLYKPGQQRISRDAGPNEETMVESAAIRIQAAYRGHTVRQSLHWRLPSGDTVQTSHRRGLQEEVGGVLLDYTLLPNRVVFTLCPLILVRIQDTFWEYVNSSVLRKLTIWSGQNGLDYWLVGEWCV